MMIHRLFGEVIVGLWAWSGILQTVTSASSHQQRQPINPDIPGLAVEELDRSESSSTLTSLAVGAAEGEDLQERQGTAGSGDLGKEGLREGVPA